MVVEIIQHLHENVDGSSSPDGMYGDRIPMSSRIVSAASYFDHNKMAHPENSNEDILNKMDEKTGIIFDESIMRALGEYIA